MRWDKYQAKKLKIFQYPVKQIKPLHILTKIELNKQAKNSRVHKVRVNLVPTPPKLSLQSEKLF